MDLPARGLAVALAQDEFRMQILEDMRDSPFSEAFLAPQGSIYQGDAASQSRRLSLECFRSRDGSLRRRTGGEEWPS